MDGLRKCIVKIARYNGKHNKNKNKAVIEEVYRGYFHMWNEEKDVVNGLVYGTTGGQKSTLYAVVEYEDGTIHRVMPECVVFVDW